MSQFVPSSPDLLAAVAAVLDAVLPTAPGHLQHEVRVAANLTRIVERELRLGTDPAAFERDTLAALGDAPDERALWDALVAFTRHDLRIAKPGYDAWEHG